MRKIIIMMSLFITLVTQVYAQIQNFVIEPGEWSFLGADGRSLTPSSDVILSDSSKVSIVWKYDKTSGWSAYSPDTSINLGSYLDSNMTIAQGKGFWVKWKNVSVVDDTIPTTISDLGTKEIVFFQYYSNTSSCNSAAYDKYILKIDGTVSKSMYCYDGATLASSPINGVDTSRTWSKTSTGFNMMYSNSTYWYTWNYSNIANVENGFSATEHFTSYDNQDSLYTNGFVYTVTSSNITTPTTETFNVSSTSFTNGSALLLKYSATVQGGQNISPQLSWSGTQFNIGKYAIVMDDETSPCGTGNNACVHWNVFNLPSSITSLAENQSISAISGAIVGYAYNGQSGYNGPNPPWEHTYKITVYALSSSMPAISTSELTSYGYEYGMTRSQFEYQYGSYILNKTTISTVFTPIN